jgi:hypothetical protein
MHGPAACQNVCTSFIRAFFDSSLSLTKSLSRPWGGILLTIFSPEDEKTMATPNGGFEFINGPVRHRTKRIEPEEWEKWRPLIIELFLDFNLAQVITRMQLEHGFCAK